MKSCKERSPQTLALSRRGRREGSSTMQGRKGRGAQKRSPKINNVAGARGKSKEREVGSGKERETGLRKRL